MAKKKEESETTVALKSVIEQLGQGELEVLRKGAEDKLRKNKAKELPIVRIGTSWYIYDEDINRYNLTSPTELKRDLGDSWSWDKPRYLDWTYVPSYLDYQKVIHTGTGMYLNSHAPVDWTFEEGEFPVIAGGIQHIFGDKAYLAYQYIKVLLTNPTHPLPILCLVGLHNNGKTWFAKLIQKIVNQNNSVEIDANDFTIKFNGHWANKHVLVIDETETEGMSGRNNLSSKLKKLNTSARIILERKGKDAFESEYYGKIIVCSNKIKSFLKIEKTDDRYFVIKVEELPAGLRSDTFEKDAEAEFPRFLNFIINKMEMPERKGRFYLPYAEYKTRALEEVKDNSNSSMVTNIKEVLYEWFQNPILLDETTNCWYAVQDFDLFDKSMMSQTAGKQWRFSGTEIINLLRKRGLKVPDFKYLKICMEEEMRISLETKYDKFKGGKKKGYLIIEEELVKMMH